MKTLLMIGCVLGALVGGFGIVCRIQHWALSLEFTVIGGTLFLISLVMILLKRKTVTNRG